MSEQNTEQHINHLRARITALESVVEQCRSALEAEISQLKAKCERLEREAVMINNRREELRAKVHQLEAERDVARQFAHDLGVLQKDIEAQCAEMRSALEWVQTFQGLFEGNRNTLRTTLENALSTTAGTAILTHLTALESVIEQCDRSLEACLRWPQVSKNEHLNGVQASRAAIKKVKGNQ